MIKTTIVMAILTAALGYGSTLATTYVGFEDWTGPTSDRDFNDTVLALQGIDFNVTGMWNLPTPLAYPLETPFPYSTASYFDSAVAAGTEVNLSFVIHQTADTETAYVRLGFGDWLPVTGVLHLNSFAGEQIDFKLVADGVGTLYADTARNPDDLEHAIEAQDAPEPQVALLVGLGLLGVWWASKRRQRADGWR